MHTMRGAKANKYEYAKKINCRGVKLMTRDQFHEKVKSDPNYIAWHNAHEMADELYDEIEINTSCEGCTHKPTKKETDPMVCSECSRWYRDQYKKGKT